MPAFSLRTAESFDGYFLADMLVEAANWDQRFHRPRPEILEHPVYRRFIAGWMRPGDAGVVAEDGEGHPIGASWFRLMQPLIFDAANPPRIPELVIGVRSPYRAQGVGRALLREVCARARTQGMGRLALHVHEDNPAVALYRSEGFAWESNLDGRDFMVRRFG